MSKRKKFLITSALLASGFVGINFLDNEVRFWAIGGLTILTIVLFYWSLAEGLALDATLLTLVLPALFTLGVGIFWFLLPATIFARIPVVALYGLGIYALGLTLNIYTVSAIRTIALSRAAKGVGFVLTLFTAFLLFDALFSLKTQIWIFAPAIVTTSFPLFLQGFWSTRLTKEIEKKLLFYSLISGLLIGEIGLMLYFWPVTIVVGSLFLTIGVYILLGLGQASLEGRLFTQTVRDYLTVWLLVFLSMLIVTRWAG